jgi:hypothetical protein
MDEMTALRESWVEEPPAPAARERARDALLWHIAVSGTGPARPGPRAAVSSRARRRLWSLRSGLATAAAAGALGAAVVVGGGLDRGTPPARPEASGSGAGARTEATAGTGALDLAARYAGAQSPAPAPRPDQWIFVEMRVAASGPIGRSKNHGVVLPPRTDRSWTRADGRKEAFRDEGRLVVQDVWPHPMPRDYETLASLPTEPRELLEWVKGRIVSNERGELLERAKELTRDRPDGPAFVAFAVEGSEFQLIRTMLTESLLTPGVEAAAIRALALIPGVTEVPGLVEVGGRSAIAIGKVEEGWLRREVLVDHRTHQVIGTREIAVADHSFAVGDDSGEVVRIKKGEVESLLLRTAIKVVDAPGRTS